MTLTERQLSDVRAVADELDREHRLREQSAAYAACAVSGDASGPALHLDDVSGIPFLDGITGIEFYQLRARVRARQGDAYAATCAAIGPYERYNQTRLALGAPTFIEADGGDAPVRVAEACRHGTGMDSLADFARASGSLIIHPYMGIESVWSLAGDVGVRAGVPVSVLAPPPPMTWFANDKMHVDQLARAVVEPLAGGPAVVDTEVGRTASELAAHLMRLARTHPLVALKATRCASAMGNEVFDAAGLISVPDVERRVEGFMRDKQVGSGESVLAVAWEDNRVSPSTQLWIPPAATGKAPVVEGVYEQLLEGDERVFLGSRASELGREQDERLVLMSLLMAAAYQWLGYVGRCSFDFIVSDGVPLIVECNGRWGGTSTPMHLVDRVCVGPRPHYRARDYVDPRLKGMAVGELLTMLATDLYDVSTGAGRYIVYNVGCLGLYGKFDVIALGGDRADAERALEESLPRLLDERLGA